MKGAAPAPGSETAHRPLGPRLVLYLFLIAALAFLLQRLFRVDAPLEERRDRLARLESSWNERLATAGTPVERGLPALVERWQGLRREGSRPWRIRLLAPTDDRDRPPATPRGLKARFDGSTADIVLTWEPTDDADMVIIHRTIGNGQSALTLAVDGSETTWSDQVLGLNGEYVYWLQARRGALRSPDSTRVSETFSIDAALRLDEVDLTGKTPTATITVAPRPGPRPAGFVGARFRVQVDEIVGAPTGTFDYTTTYRLVELGETEVEEMVFERAVPRFAPDGTRLRDEKGRPLTHGRLLPRPIRKPYARVKARGRNPVTIFRDR